MNSLCVCVAGAFRVLPVIAEFSGDSTRWRSENRIVEDETLKAKLEELLASIRQLTAETKRLVRDSEELIRNRQKILDRYEARRTDR